MKISLNSIKSMNRRYGCVGDITPDGVDALVARIGAQLGAVETVTDFGSKYADVVIAKVVTCVKHENSDHLNVCTLDDAGVTPDVNRDEQGRVQVVCGAPNVRAGLTVAWLPPGATVPETYDTDPFVLEARELRGVVSNGMLASLRELALGDDHEGILEIDDDVAAGTKFADFYNLINDQVIDIENKMFTHRPDCFGFLGVSRELAGIQNLAFKSPDWYQLQPTIPAVETEPLPLTVQNEIPALVPRFSAITMRDVKLGPSPLWLKIELAKVGLRSINNIVDYTNFFMLETGQPLHAYDYDKVRALDGGDSATMVVRQPRANETITLLNGKQVDPRQEAIMIATQSRLIGIGGVMGGFDTEVDETTNNIIIEAATFDMYSIRRTSMTHGLFTDAVSRFNKGQSPLQTVAVLAKIVNEIRTYAGGKVASELIDSSQVGDRQWVHPPVPVTVSFINDRLGSELTAGVIKQLLENVECQVVVEAENVTVSAPFWRTDIETREDIVEEVGRLYGFDRLPVALPQRTINPVQKDQTLTVKQAIRAQLAKMGANELLTYSFIHGDLIQKAQQNKDEAFQISNALSPDLQYYRLSLVPNLLEKVHSNLKAGYDQFALFEIGKVHGQSQLDAAGLPKEMQRVALVVAAEAKEAGKAFAGAPYYQAQYYALTLLQSFGLTNNKLVNPVTADIPHNLLFNQMIAPFDPTRSAFIYNGDALLGIVGEFQAPVRRALKLPDFCAGFEFFLSPFMASSKQPYAPLPRFPKVTQDITLKAAAEVPFQSLNEMLQATAADSKVITDAQAITIYLLDSYQAADSDQKQWSFRVIVTNNQRTMSDAEVTKLLDELAAAAHDTLNAERV